MVTHSRGSSASHTHDTLAAQLSVGGPAARLLCHASRMVGGWVDTGRWEDGRRGQKGGQTKGQMDGWVDTDGWKDGWWVGGWKHRQTHGRVHGCQGPCALCQPPTCRKVLLRSSAQVILPDQDRFTV